jgi:NAD(P)-dependent dehydrogenase (short-subunit alcohol dehydrogenase family)
LLTRLLLPLFQAGEDNRIINLTSVVYPLGRFNYDKVNSYRGFKAYAVSKYMLLLFTFHLAEELKSVGICVNAVHPGVIRTNIFSTKNWYTLLINTVFRFFLTSVEKGSEPVIRLAVQSDLKTADDDYYLVFKRRKVSGKINSEAIRTNLIEQTDKRLFD